MLRGLWLRKNNRSLALPSMLSLAITFARLAAFLFIAAGFVLPWFRVPIDLHIGKNGAYDLTYQERITTLVFQALLIMFLVVGVWMASRRESNQAKSKVLVTTSCLVLVGLVVFYPAITIQRCPRSVAHAAWLEMQNESLILPAGDTFTGQEYVYQPGEPEVDIKQVLPQAFAVVPTPSITSFYGVRLASLARLVMWLGYTPEFCQFIGKGWFSAIFGAALLGLSFTRVRDRREEFERTNDVYSSGLLLLISGSVSVLICLIPVVMAGRELDSSHTAVAQGNYEGSLHHLKLAEIWLPILGFQTDLLYQVGWLKEKLNTGSPETSLMQALRLEEEGSSVRAEEIYTELLAPGVPDPVRQEAFRAQLRMAIADFNSGLLSTAGTRLKKLIVLDPTSVKVNYALQLWHIRNKQKAALEDDVARFQAIYKCFGSLEKSPLLALAHRRLADLEFDYGDTAKLTEEMREAVTP
jgi:hypothetical protein